MGESNPLWKAGIILLLVFIKAVTAAAETAVHAVNEGTIRKKALEGDKKASLILKYIEMPDHYSSIFRVILSGTSVLAGTVYQARLLYYSDKYSDLFHGYLSEDIMKSIVLAATTLILLYIVILFGNILPKKLALINPIRCLYAAMPLVWFFTCLLKPFTLLLDGSISLIFFLFRINPKDILENVTQEEIISMVNEGHEQGVLEESEVEMISNIIEFDEKEVKDIMTHRKKIVSISMELTLEEAINHMLEEGFSRCPLYEDDIDDIVGILHLKDMMKYYVSDRDKGISLKSIAREPYFIPDTQGIDMLFHDMQVKKIHMAVAIDEYGQTAGIVAMEDLIEEIVGNIFDEYDVEEKVIIKQGDQRFLMKGLAPLEDVEEALGIEIDQEDYDTLNGLLISILGHIPDEKERVNIAYKGYLFHIIDVKDKMIGYVRVSRQKEQQKAAD